MLRITVQEKALTENKIIAQNYNTGFSQFRFGYASAQAWALFLAILVFVLFAIRTSSSWVQYER